jgi:hypothetical protein
MRVVETAIRKEGGFLMRKVTAAAAVLGVVLSAGGTARAAPPPQGIQPISAFEASYLAEGVTNVSATTQQRSCYRPEVLYLGALPALQGYPGGGASPCAAGLPPSAPFTGENVGPYPTQDAAGAGNPVLLVKDHSESDIRVDPTNPSHLIGQSKWIVNAEGYNHLNGFYESFDGGTTWPLQGHVPGYEGWTDNTDPVGAFDPWGNFYSLLLAYNFYYDKFGFHRFDNGTNQTNPTVPPEAVSVSVHPHASAGANDWITTHDGHPDFVATASNAKTNDPDKQWITIDTNPESPCYRTVYAMWTIFVWNPSYLYVATAMANPNGTHSDWSSARVLPTIAGKPWDSYLLPHVAPDGTVYTTITNNPQQKGFSTADIYVISSKDCGRTWQGPLPVVKGISVPTYQNTTFREGIVNTFAVGTQKVGGAYPLYVSYEDSTGGLSNVYLTASYDVGATWTEPIQVNDNPAATEALQPSLDVASNGVASVAFYDRRLPCPEVGTAEAVAAGLQYDPGTSASPGTPYGRANYCVNTAIQFYRPDLRQANPAIGHNVRLSAHTWDPQLNAPHQGCICSSGTFIGDYFGVISSSAGKTYTTSVSTFDYAGENPTFYQQQIVAAVTTPAP